MLFSERSIWTMVHGIVGAGTLFGLAAALSHLYAARSSDGAAARPGSGALGSLQLRSPIAFLMSVVPARDKFKG